MKASDIQRLVMDLRKDANEICIPNFYVGQYELDVFRLKKDMLIEYEIKISVQDLKNDFKKFRSEGHRETRRDILKHVELAAGQLPTSQFYFVTPTDLIQPEQLPRHCGLIFCDGQRLTIVKHAPVLHKNPFTDFRRLAISLSWREAHAKGKIRWMEHQLKTVRRQRDDLAGRKLVDDRFE
jgi:hypothetical protein